VIAQGSGSEDLSEDAARVVAVIRAAGGKLACTGLRVRAALRARNVIVLANMRIEMGLVLRARPMTDLRGRLAFGVSARHVQCAHEAKATFPFECLA